MSHELCVTALEAAKQNEVAVGADGWLGTDRRRAEERREASQRGLGRDTAFCTVVWKL